MPAGSIRSSLCGPSRSPEARRALGSTGVVPRASAGTSEWLPAEPFGYTPLTLLVAREAELKFLAAPVLFGICCAASALALAAAPRAPSGRTLVAMLRLDGVVVPMAEWRGGRWQNDGAALWFDSDREPPPRPWFRPGRSMPATWAAVDTDAKMITVRTEAAAVHARAHCQVTWALACDYPRRPIRRGDPHRVVGIAVANAELLGGFDQIGRDGPEAGRLVGLLERDFVRLEDNAVSQEARRQPHVSAAVRRTHAIQVTALSRPAEPVGGRWLYHARLERHYPKPGDSACEDNSFYEAWVSDTPEPKDGGPRIIARRLTLGDCDGGDKRGSAITPYGLVRVAGRTFAVVLEHGYEDERYVLLETDGRTIRRAFVADGGGC